MSLILANNLNQFSVTHPPTALSFVATIVLLVSNIALNYYINITPSDPRYVIAQKAII